MLDYERNLGIKTQKKDMNGKQKQKESHHNPIAARKIINSFLRLDRFTI
jgi:hypothetical protein